MNKPERLLSRRDESAFLNAVAGMKIPNDDGIHRTSPRFKCSGLRFQDGNRLRGTARADTDSSVAHK